VVSEYPLGTPPAAWRFPARNRIVAALARVVVVVESGVRGGSMHTVDAALERDRTVLAVPGSVRNPAAAGSNGLLLAGCGPALDATDVLVALGLGGGRAVCPTGDGTRRRSRPTRRWSSTPSGGTPAPSSRWLTASTSRSARWRSTWSSSSASASSHEAAPGTAA
jgi:hypothetical protein